MYTSNLNLANWIIASWSDELPLELELQLDRDIIVNANLICSRNSFPINDGYLSLSPSLSFSFFHACNLERLSTLGRTPRRWAA